jgi:hypothetical protein
MLREHERRVGLAETSDDVLHPRAMDQWLRFALLVKQQPEAERTWSS